MTRIYGAQQFRFDPTSEAVLVIPVGADGSEPASASNPFLTASGKASTSNASTSPLNAGATYTGTWEDVSAYASVTAAVYTDKAGTLYMEFSADASNADSSLSFSVAEATNEVHRLAVTRRYFRVRFTNSSASNQTYLRLQCLAGAQSSLTSALNSSIQQDADALLTRQIDPFIELTLGRFVGFSMDTKFGRNHDIDAAEDIWNGGGTYTGFPTTGSAETVTITSSAGATDAGFDVVISGLDANYDQQTETVRLNGSGVGVSSSTWRRVNRAYVEPGTSSAAANAGELTCTHTTTTANVFFKMLIGANQTHVCAYTVPSGYSILIKRIYIAGARATGTTTADFALRTREQGKLFRDRRLFTAGNNVAVNVTYVGGLLVSEKTDVKISCTSISATNGDFTAEFGYVLIRN